MMDRHLRELDALLSEPLDSVRDREHTEFDRILPQSEPLIRSHMRDYRLFLHPHEVNGRELVSDAVAAGR